MSRRNRLLLKTINAKLNLVLLRLDEMEREVEDVMATQEEIVVTLTAANERLKKVGAETSALLVKIEELKAVVAVGPVSPALQAAVDAVVAQAGVLDDLVPDAPPPVS